MSLTHSSLWQIEQRHKTADSDKQTTPTCSNEYETSGVFPNNELSTNIYDDQTNGQIPAKPYPLQFFKVF